MKPAKERGFAASSLLPRRRAARYRSLLLAVMCVSSFVSVSSAPRAGRHKKPEAEADSPLESSGGLHEYRKVGMQLIGLWREYTAMSDALSHALHDFNVVVRQEQRVELARVLSRKHRQAEVTLAAEKALGRGVPPDVVYGEVASLKELKKQMKRLDRKVTTALLLAVGPSSSQQQTECEDSLLPKSFQQAVSGSGARWVCAFRGCMQSGTGRTITEKGKQCAQNQSPY
ncbi:hypothetical protein Efla_000214 [Eimeria flavescens]